MASSLSNSKWSSGPLLLGVSNLLLVSSLDLLGLFSAVELTMGVGGKIWRDSTVSSVGSSSSVDGSLGKDVADSASLDVKTLGLSIGLKVHEKGPYVSDRLFWESTVVMSGLLAHSMSSWTAGESSEWNNCSMSKDVIHERDGSLQTRPFASASSLVCRLEMSSQIVNSAFGS